MKVHLISFFLLTSQISGAVRFSVRGPCKPDPLYKDNLSRNEPCPYDKLKEIRGKIAIEAEDGAIPAFTVETYSRDKPGTMKYIRENMKIKN